MKSKSKKEGNWLGIPETDEITLEQYGTGDAAEILGIPIWRLRNLLDGPAYQLSLHDQIGGQGRGSRRVFSREGLYRLGTAAALVSDGFTPKFVGAAMEELSETDFHITPDDTDKSWGVQLRRKGNNRKPELFSGMPELKLRGSVYYALDLQMLKEWVDKRIVDWQTGNLKRSDKTWL